MTCLRSLGIVLNWPCILFCLRTEGLGGAVREQITGKPLGVLIFGKETVFKSYFWVNS